MQPDFDDRYGHFTLDGYNPACPYWFQDFRGPYSELVATPEVFMRLMNLKTPRPNDIGEDRWTPDQGYKR